LGFENNSGATVSYWTTVVKLLFHYCWALLWTGFPSWWSTDRGSDVLDNCAANAHLNSSLFKYPETSVRVRELDWKEQWPPSVQTYGSESQR